MKNDGRTNDKFEDYGDGGGGGGVGDVYPLHAHSSWATQQLSWSEE